MPWKTRGNNRYFYRSIRVGNRVRSEYCGGGAVGELVALTHQTRLHRMIAEQRRKRAQRDELVRLSAEVLRYCCQLDRYTTASLIAAGFYNHRGTWRKRMTLKIEKGQDAKKDRRTADMPIEDYLHHLAQLANQGRADAVMELRSVMDAHPEVWRPLANLGRSVENILIRSVGRNNVLALELLRRELDELKRELVSDTAPVLERMAAQRVAVAWLELQVTDLHFPEAATDLIMRRKQVAQNRFDKAIRLLDLVRQSGTDKQSSKKSGVARLGSMCA